MRSVIGYAVCLVVALTIGYTFSPKSPPQVELLATRPDRVQINGLLNLGSRVVAVGERGSILLSDDQGVSWQPAAVATQRNATLTAVVALDDRRLLAVGHDGWILRSGTQAAVGRKCVTTAIWANRCWASGPAVVTVSWLSAASVSSINPWMPVRPGRRRPWTSITHT